jgi:hypothetical protein
MGLPSCSYCSGISENHSGACAENKAKMKSFLERKKKLTEANGATPTKSNKPTRRTACAASTTACARSSARSSRRT